MLAYTRDNGWSNTYQAPAFSGGVPEFTNRFFITPIVQQIASRLGIPATAVRMTEDGILLPTGFTFSFIQQAIAEYKEKIGLNPESTLNVLTSDTVAHYNPNSAAAFVGLGDSPYQVGMVPLLWAGLYGPTSLERVNPSDFRDTDSFLAWRTGNLSDIFTPGAVAAVSAVITNLANSIPSWNNIGKFITETIPQSIGKFVTETIPQAVGKFFTETIPQSLGSVVPESWKNFFTETLPQSSVGKFFTETIPQSSVGKFFTETIPNFFTETIPQSRVGKLFTEVIPNKAAEAIEGTKKVYEDIKKGATDLWNNPPSAADIWSKMPSLPSLPSLPSYDSLKKKFFGLFSSTPKPEQAPATAVPDVPQPSFGAQIFGELKGPKDRVLEWFGWGPKPPEAPTAALASKPEPKEVQKLDPEREPPVLPIPPQQPSGTAEDVPVCTAQDPSGRNYHKLRSIEIDTNTPVAAIDGSQISGSGRTPYDTLKTTLAALTTDQPITAPAGVKVQTSAIAMG